MYPSKRIGDRRDALGEPQGPPPSQDDLAERVRLRKLAIAARTNQVTLSRR